MPKRQRDDDIEKIDIIELSFSGSIIPWGYYKFILRKIDILAQKANGLTKKVNITAKKANGVTKEVKEIKAKKAN